MAISHLKVLNEKRVGVVKKEWDARQGRILRSGRKQAHSMALAKLIW
jgi:hypothetical protein